MSAHLALDQLFDPVLALNSKGELVYFNHQASIFFKLPPRLLKQKKSVSELTDAYDFDVNEWIKKSIASNDTQLSPEFKVRLPHEVETEYYVIFKLIPMGEEYVVVIHDKTVETNLHTKYRDQLEELKKTHSQILQADKLTTLGELTANISHEINNPLTIAAGHSEIMQDILSSKDPIKNINTLVKANQAITDSIERVNQIIKNMKDFLRQSEEEKEYCDLGSLIETATEWINPVAKKSNVTITRDANVHAVSLVNRIKIEQVIINLIKNSIDALNSSNTPNGEVKIRVTKSETDQQTYIDIIDNGPGMPDQIKKNLFKPFQSTKDAGHGTGLGLSICQKIVEGHRGKLELIPVQNGCQFRIRLPLIELYSYTRNDRSLSGNKLQKKILVLDNEVQILNVLNTFISADNLVFIGSSDPNDALSFLKKADVDLIVTDINMPTMNGNEFAKQVRAIGFSGPILYMTSSKYVEQFNKDKKDLDIDGLILKPFSKDEVMNSIRASLKKEAL